MLRVVTTLILALSLAGCDKSKAKDGEVRRIRDSEVGVTCWIVMSSGAISCVRDAPEAARSTTTGAP